MRPPQARRPAQRRAITDGPPTAGSEARQTARPRRVPRPGAHQPTSRRGRAGFRGRTPFPLRHAPLERTVSSGYGRHLRFLVVDEQNDKLIGVVGLGDPVFSLADRDRWIGWDTQGKTQGLHHVMDAFALRWSTSRLHGEPVGGHRRHQEGRENHLLAWPEPPIEQGLRAALRDR